jgi:hypothetical protein
MCEGVAEHMDDAFRRAQMEQELKHKHELYEMYQTCKDELHGASSPGRCALSLSRRGVV